jgi:hypothetical protein
VTAYCPVCEGPCELEQERADYIRLQHVTPVSDDAAVRLVETMGRARIHLERLERAHERTAA